MWYQLYRWMDGSQGRFQMVWGREYLLLLPQFDPWIFQLVASRHTVYTTPAPSNIYFYTKFNFIEVIVANDAPDSQICTGFCRKVGNANSQISITSNLNIFVPNFFKFC